MTRRSHFIIKLPGGMGVLGGLRCICAPPRRVPLQHPPSQMCLYYVTNISNEEYDKAAWRTWRVYTLCSLPISVLLRDIRIYLSGRYYELYKTKQACYTHSYRYTLNYNTMHIFRYTKLWKGARGGVLIVVKNLTFLDL